MNDDMQLALYNEQFTDGQAVSLTAIRTCYSPNNPTDIVNLEGEKYFGSVASDGEGGTEADRLIRHIARSGHTSTLEHLSFQFMIEGVSRSLLAQLTRQRAGFSYSVQSQRYVRFGSEDKSKGFDYVIPPSIVKHEEGTKFFENMMAWIQTWYDELRAMGIPAEDARFILPNAATCNIVLSANLRALLTFYSKRKPGRGAQWEIAQLAEEMKNVVVEVEPWTEKFFDEV
jgi:thymidylate synthase (FAD)